jgi:glycosyltransferase involved in cell wall biosynthesis
MPTYNDAETVARAIDAILNQSHQDFELIIINDGSTDTTDQIVRKYALQDKRIKYIRNSVNCGVVKSLNSGCRHASGKYIYCGSSDDWIAEGFFEKAIFQLEKNPEINLCFFDVTFVEDGVAKPKKALPEFKEVTKFSSKEMLRNMKKRFCTNSCASVLKKSKLQERNYFAEEVGFFCDLLAYIPIALEGAIYIPEVGANFTRNSEGTEIRRSKKYLINELSQLLNYLKMDKNLFRKLCYSKVLPRSFSYDVFIILLKPRYWSFLVPMCCMKSTLIYPKLINFLNKK